MREELVRQWVDSFEEWPAAPRENAAGGTGRMTGELYPYKKLFSPLKINKLTLKNRIAMAPMGNIDMCEETGRPDARMLEYFFARAKGGAGLLTTGLVPVSHGIDPTVTEPGELSYFPRIDRSRTVFCGWRDLAQGVHALGSRMFVQLSPGLGRVGNPQCLHTRRRFPVSASFNPNYYMPGVPCLRISDGALRKIIRNTGQAAADAKAMGLDGVYLHGHEGYLLEQMANPAFNRRILGWFADPTCFGTDLVAEIRRRVGPDYPILYRIDLSLALEETYGDALRDTPMKKFKKGRSIADTLAYMEQLVRAGVDAFDVDLGCYDNWWLPHPPAGMPAGCFLPAARLVKEHFAEKKILSNAGLPVPVAGVGKLGYPDIAEQALRGEDCDLVMLGRPLLADPDWPLKAYSGRVEEIRPCIGCQEGCLNEFVEGGHIQCAVNPRTGFEHLLPEHPPLAEKPKRVAVVGGGPGGMAAAITAGRQGHRVVLYEAGAALGGRLLAGGVPAIKFDVENYLEYLQTTVKTMERRGAIRLKMQTPITLEKLAQFGYDAIIFASGAHPVAPPLQGEGNVPSLQAAQLLARPAALPDDARQIVVVGGGALGCEVAQWLACEKARSVAVVEQAPHMMEGLCTANRGHMLRMLQKNGVKLYNCSQLIQLEPKGVRLLRNTHQTVPNPYDTWSPVLPKNIQNPLAAPIEEAYREEVLAADLVVSAIGSHAADAMYYEAQRRKTAPELYSLGDGFAPGRIQQAVHAAYRTALAL